MLIVKALGNSVYLKKKRVTKILVPKPLHKSLIISQGQISGNKIAERKGVYHGLSKYCPIALQKGVIITIKLCELLFLNISSQFGHYSFLKFFPILSVK